MFKLITVLVLISIRSSYERHVNSIGLSDANNHFGLKLLQNLIDYQKNVFFSPLSISYAFGILYSGAKGRTAEELKEILGYNFGNISDQQIEEQFSDVLNKINDKNSKSYELNVLNKIVIQKDFSILKTFEDNVRKYFKSSIDLMDFQNDPKSAINAINKWVAKQTNDKIKELLSEPLDPMTRIIILNAVYFKGLFQTKFEKRDTREEVFFNSGSDEIKTQMMRRTGKFNYTEVPAIDAKLLEMPYIGDDISLYILLPNQRQGLNGMSKNIPDFKIIEKSITHLHQTEVVVTVPKFTIKTSYQLKDQLSRMGLKSVFSKSADLSAINGFDNLFVSQVIHKAFVEVSEEGTEAAAATAVKIMVKKSIRYHQKPVFRAEHPFLFFIRDNTNGMILFCGHLNTL